MLRAYGRESGATVLITYLTNLLKEEKSGNAGKWKTENYFKKLSYHTT